MSNFRCRACGGEKLTSFLDLGVTPLSNAMVPFDRADEAEIAHPLHAFVCNDCFLVQLGEFETPKTIFSDDYTYFSSFSRSWLDHAKTYRDDMVERFSLDENSHVAEVASNDGYLLRWFLEKKIKVTGIEPADNCAEAARKIGVTTICEFFGTNTAREIAQARGKADLIAANNVLAHVPDLIDFVGGFAEMLNPQGVATFEFPHLLNLMELNQFDTIYHEHFSYLALQPVIDVLEKQGLRVFDVEQWPTHGGSLRVFVCHDASKHQTQNSIAEILKLEAEAGLYQLETYASSLEAVRSIKDASLEFLINARRDGKSVVAYGAAAKGATFLNYCGVGVEYIDYVVDRNPIKQNRFMPGVRIPVYAVEKLVEDNPDYVVILPWNLKVEITAQLRELGVQSKIVTAIPNLDVSQ